MRKLVIVISYSLGFLFLYAALSKLNGYGKFEVTIGQNAMLHPYAGWLAWMVPCAEMVLAVMLVFPRLRRLALYGSLGLMAMFTAYVFIVWVFEGPDVPCQCGGVLSAMSWGQHLVFNMVFTGLAGVGVVLEEILRFRSG